MTPIAVFYHCKIEGHGIPDPEFAQGILYEQMRALKESGLESAASEIHIGVNGGEGQSGLFSELCPSKAVIHFHGDHATTELPTFSILREWVRHRPGWNVCYHHSKGVTMLEQGQFNIEGKAQHRRTMERAVIWNWRKCVEDLDRGYDAVGINLVDPVKRPVLPGRFFAGNFWWARSTYLAKLPRIPDTAFSFNIRERIVAEGWVCSGGSKAKLMDHERPELYSL